jgi:hypothetical protein
LSLETCRGRKINTLKKVKKVRQVGCKSRISSYIYKSFNVIKEIITVRPVNNMRYIKTLSGKNAAFLVFKQAVRIVTTAFEELKRITNIRGSHTFMQ